MRFALDVGHGTNNKKAGVYDSGAVGQNRHEHVMVKGMANRQRRNLTKLGHQVLVIVDQPLGKRGELAADFRADFMLSIHCNAHSVKSANGVECWVDPSASARGKKVATLMCANIAKAAGLRNRGVKRNWFAVLKRNPHDCLIELFFLSNKSDFDKYEANVDKVELGILNALLVGCGLKAVTSLPRKAK